MEQFERAKVVMLPAKRMLDAYKTPITEVYEDEGKLYLNKKEIGELITELGSPQHLYIISDDEIKENDYCLNLETNTVFKMHKHGLPTSNRNKKIVATTDTSLNYIEHDDTVPYPKGVQIRLPQPSQQFITEYIEEYNKGNIIADVLVEYKRVFETVAKGMIGHPEDDISWWNEKLKINPNDNTITIKKLKDSWNREEYAADVKRLCNLLYFSSNRDVDFNTKEELDNWIDQNL